MPCDRPMHGVSLCSMALAAVTSMRRLTPLWMISMASTNCRLSAVSFTSLEVRPWCSHLRSSPSDSPTARVKETMSCFVSSNHRSYAARLNSALRIKAMSSGEITPSSVHASDAATSMRSQNSNMWSSDHTAFICGRE